MPRKDKIVETPASGLIWGCVSLLARSSMSVWSGVLSYIEDTDPDIGQELGETVVLSGFDEERSGMR